MINWTIVWSLLVAFIFIVISFIILAIIGLKVLIYLFTKDAVKLSKVLEQQKKEKNEREFERTKESVWNFK